MSYKDPIGDRIKKYESAASSVMIDGTPKIIRLDGKAFHTWVKKAGMNKPFDIYMMGFMVAGAKGLMEEIGGNARFAYIQSDECTVVMNDKLQLNSQPWFGNKVQKITSVASSVYTAHFNQQANDKPLAYFDARVFEVPSIVEMRNTVLWRQFDAQKNSVSMYAQSMFSHKELQGKNTGEMKEMMKIIKDFDWGEANPWTQRGVLVYRVKVPKTLDSGEVIERSELFADFNIPCFKETPDYLKNLYIAEELVPISQ